MAVDREISLAVVRRELSDCQGDAELFGWDIFEIHEDTLTFTVKMISSVDKEIYLIEFKFDDYREAPLFIEFIDPKTGQAGTKNAYPLGKDSFFNTTPFICHPGSRKAYVHHTDWGGVGWQSNRNTGGLKSIRAILLAISERINDSEQYKGRQS